MFTTSSTSLYETCIVLFTNSCAVYRSLFFVQRGYTAAFAIGLILYAFLYRPLIDSIRLRQLGLIKKREAWKLIYSVFQLSVQVFQTAIFFKINWLIY